MKNKRVGMGVYVGLILLIAALAACTTPAPPPAAPKATATPGSRITPLPQATATSALVTADGETLVTAKCVGCHSLERVRSAKKTRDAWSATIMRMVNLGGADTTALLDYLAMNYRP